MFAQKESRYDTVCAGAKEEMARKFAEAFYKSKKWQKCRATYILYRKSVDGGLCETCREKLGKIVHHKIPLTPENINDPDISLGMANLKYDCKDCHEREDHGYGKKQPEEMPRYYFNEKGETVILPPVKRSDGKGA